MEKPEKARTYIFLHRNLPSSPQAEMWVSWWLILNDRDNGLCHKHNELKTFIFVETQKSSFLFASESGSRFRLYSVL
jgi:hypothetical protein